MVNSSSAVRPEDILPDGQDIIVVNNKEIRKGSIAAFVKNINILENSELEQQRTDALNAIKELAPVVIEIDLYKHATFKNPIVQNILEQEERKLQSEK